MGRAPVVELTTLSELVVADFDGDPVLVVVVVVLVKLFPVLQPFEPPGISFAVSFDSTGPFEPLLHPVPSSEWPT